MRTYELSAVKMKHSVPLASCPFYWVPCLGFTQTDLTLIMRSFLLQVRGTLLLSHGDDSLLVSKYGDIIIMFEADLSSCDRSLTTPALTCERQLIDSVLAAHNMDQKFFDSNLVAWRLSHAERVIDQHFVVNLDDDAQRPTGCTRTSLMNTVLAAVPYINLAIRRNENIPFIMQDKAFMIRWFAAHGFDIKCQVLRGTVSDFPLGTFLKGAWFRTSDNDVAWTRLPSMTLKMFKTQKSFAELTRTTKNENVSLAEARYRYCGMLARSLEPYSLLPGISHWVARWSNVAVTSRTIPSEGRVEAGTERYAFDLDSAITKLAERYEICPQYVAEWISIVAMLEPGTSSIHPMWMALAKDY